MYITEICSFCLVNLKTDEQVKGDFHKQQVFRNESCTGECHL